MLSDEIQELVIGPLGIVEAQLGIRRPLLAQQSAHAQPGVLRDTPELLPRRRLLEVLDHFRFDTGLPDQRERVARRSAVGVVVDGDAHAIALLPEFAPLWKPGVQANAGRMLNGSAVIAECAVASTPNA